MTVTMPESVTFGKVIGRFVEAVGDTTGDVDILPDAVAASGSITFTPANVVNKETSAAVPTTIIRKPVKCFLNSNGEILDPNGVIGVWLVTGVYKVSYALNGTTINGHDIEVTSGHTDASPLDLTLAIPLGTQLSPSQYETLNNRIEFLEPGLSRYLVEENGTYRAIPDPVSAAVTFVGSVDPNALGMMRDGDSWINTSATDTPYPYVPHFEGHGSPEAVVTAQVGSRYIDLDVTNGAVEWIKKTGSGNTGWRVVYGDTGWRNINSLLVNGWSLTLRIRRIGDLVEIGGRLDGTLATADTFIAALPAGFKFPYGSFTKQYGVGTGTLVMISSTCELRSNYRSSSGDILTNWTTGDSWPTSLPGSPA